MLNIENLSKSFGQQLLFRDANFVIGDQARIGVVGPNGSGKSTFFRMLVNEEYADHGQIRKPKQYRIALMQQEWIPHEGDSILEATLRNHHLWFEARKHLRQHEHALETDHSEAMLQVYQRLELEFSVLGGYGMESRAKELLTGLGFKPDQFDTPCTALSGGWRMRVHLAGLLLQEADLLLLDEPTNHLDVESIIWFEAFLKNYAHAILLISHDRRLIESFSEEVLEFSSPRLTLWPGGLKQFERQKIARIAELEAEIANKEREIAHLKEFIDRFKAKATKARQAQSRMKTVDNYLEEIATLKAQMPSQVKRPSRFHLSPSRRMPKIVLEMQKSVIGYTPTRPLFSIDKCVIESGKKIGVIGVNGVGKSTFLKTCAGELPLLSGTLKRNPEIPIGYFAQHRMEELELDMNALDYLMNDVKDSSISTVRGVAAAHGLSANDLDKNINVLSGGEKARVSLSRILLSRPGLLLLDEPTNHLDIEACDALVRGLSDYEGTVLVVSHNRDFLDSLVTMILEVRPGEALLHYGNYSDWLQQHAPIALPTSKQNAAKAPNNKRQEAKARQQKSQESRELKKKITVLEKQLETLLKERDELDLFLCTLEAPKSPDFGAKVKRRGLLDDEIQKIETAWLELNEQLQ